MSTSKRPRRRQTENTPPHASKRQKLDTAKQGLGFLVNEDARPGRIIDAKLTNGVPNSKATRVDESRALVTKTLHEVKTPAQRQVNEVVDISSAEEEDDDDEEEDDDDDEEENGQDSSDNAANKTTQLALMNGHDDESMADLDTADNGEGGTPMEDLEEPSLGDLLQARHPQPIDVQASFADPSTQRSALIPTGGDRALTAPSTTSLGTVLTQALKTNDRDLLESCFQVTDLPSVRSTIQRLPSQYVATLLQRLAERIHKAPGRAGVLMVWVQWSVVAHGGYLAGQPDLLRKLKSLNQVVRERAHGLQPLLHLKGKLDMLSAQLELRRSMLALSRASNERDDEEGVLYIEGQEDEDSSDDENIGTNTKTTRSRQKVKVIADVDGEESADEMEFHRDGPNGLAHDSNEDDEDSDDDDGEDEEGLIDIEAEETSDDDDDEDEDEEADSSDVEDDDEEDEDEEDSLEDEEDGESVVRAPAPKTLNRKR